MPVENQISAYISDETKEQIERYTRAKGVKKNFLIEEALRHHLLALRELPTEFIVHPQVVLSKASGKALLASMRKPPRKIPKLRRLMSTRADR